MKFTESTTQIPGCTNGSLSAVLILYSHVEICSSTLSGFVKLKPFDKSSISLFHFRTMLYKSLFDMLVSSCSKKCFSVLAMNAHQLEGADVNSAIQRNISDRHPSPIHPATDETRGWQNQGLLASMGFSRHWDDNTRGNTAPEWTEHFCAHTGILMGDTFDGKKQVVPHKWLSLFP